MPFSPSPNDGGPEPHRQPRQEDIAARSQQRVPPLSDPVSLRTTHAPQAAPHGRQYIRPRPTCPRPLHTPIHPFIHTPHTPTSATPSTRPWPRERPLEITLLPSGYDYGHPSLTVSTVQFGATLPVSLPQPRLRSNPPTQAPPPMGAGLDHSTSGAMVGTSLLVDL